MKDNYAGPFPKSCVGRDQLCENKNGKDEFDVQIDIVEVVVRHFIFTHPKTRDLGKQCIKNKYTEQLPPAGAGAQQPPYAGQQANKFKNNTGRKRHGLSFYGQRAPSSNTKDESGLLVFIAPVAPSVL